MSVGCASTTTSVVTATNPSPATTREASPDPWPLRVREHVDLWLHGFAMLSSDSSLIPYFRPGYRDRLSAERRRANLTTLLDANAERLRSRLQASAVLVSAQFVALYFESWDELRRAAEVFQQLEGDARRAMNNATAQAVATFAAYFPTAADRDWLRLFIQTLEDERRRFYDAHWREQQRALAPVYDRVESLWRARYYARFAPFLANSRQRLGEVVLALPLAGEGRTLAPGNRPSTVTVGFPGDTGAAIEAILIFAHEVMGSVASTVVTDNLSPADRRGGLADQYTSLGTVRGGAMLLRRVAPELVENFQRYYLALARVSVTGSDVDRVFAATFPLPDPLRAALERQVDIILAGI